MRFLLVFLFCTIAHAQEFPVGWDEHMAYMRENVSHPRHLPYVLSHGTKTARSVLLVHGTYSSPLRFRQMAETFFRDGYNVVTVLLPGHWNKDIYYMGKMNESEWPVEVAKGFAFARQMGDKVILAGHSLGALLLLEQATLHPDEVQGLVFIAPCLRLNGPTLLAASAGTAFDLDGNFFTRQKPDGVEVPWFAPNAGKMIHSTYTRIMNLPSPNVPVFMAYTWADHMLDTPYLQKWFKNLPTTQKKSLSYSLFSGVTHDNIGQGPHDESGASSPYFDSMMLRILGNVHSWE